MWLVEPYLNTLARVCPLINCPANSGCGIKRLNFFKAGLTHIHRYCDHDHHPYRVLNTYPAPLTETFVVMASNTSEPFALA